MLLTFAGTAQKKQIKLQVSQYMPYCGGIKPPKEIEDASKLPQHYANSTLVYKDAKGKVDSVKTNDSGSVTLNLKAGTYRFYESWKYYKKLPDPTLINNYDKACMKKEWAKSFSTITVSAGSVPEVHKIEIHAKCPHQQPCAIKTYMPE